MASAAESKTHAERWMDGLAGGHLATDLADLLAEGVVFHSPIVHTPQEGKAITLAYLSAAGEALFNDSFEYVRVFDCGQRAVLEFETEMDGVHVNGVDMIEWDAEGKILEFKVMIRPLLAIQAVHAEMARRLAAMQAGGAGSPG